MDTVSRRAGEPLARLLAGNRRFVTGTAQHQDHSPSRRIELVDGQTPFATVLGCADSRVPPEVVFDQGLGDLFTVRVAGNTATDPLVLGSIEYSAVELGTSFVMVLGHGGCGAVRAAIDVTVEGKALPGDIGALVQPIIPAVEAAREGRSGNLLDRAIRANVARSVEALRSASPLLADLVSGGRLEIVGACYELTTGEVHVVAE